MRICHITTVHKQGDSRIFHKECVSVARAGHEVYLVVANGQSEVVNGVKIIGVPFQVGSRVKRILGAGKEAMKEAAKLNADIYHLHDPELLRIARKLKKKTGAKVVYDSHEDLQKQVLDKHWIPGPLRRIVSKLVHRYEMRVTSKLDGVISVTKIICNKFRSANSNVALVANYPILGELEASMSVNKKLNSICYVGGLFPTRGIKELVQSLEFCNAELLLAGNFSTPEFESELKQLDGWKKVHYYGFVNREKIAEIIHSSEVGMVTLHPTRSYKEALPIKLFEYMSVGIPVIASDFELWKPYVLDVGCGLMADPQDPKSIASKIDYLLSNKEEASEMGERGRKVAYEKYSWSSQAETLLNFYSSLIDS